MVDAWSLKGLLLLSIAILHDLMYQTTRSHGSMVYMGLCMVHVINSIAPAWCPDMYHIHTWTLRVVLLAMNHWSVSLMQTLWNLCQTKAPLPGPQKHVKQWPKTLKNIPKHRFFVLLLDLQSIHNHGPWSLSVRIQAVILGTLEVQAFGVHRTCSVWFHRPLHKLEVAQTGAASSRG